MKIRTRKFVGIGGISRTVVTLGWLLGVTSMAWSQTLGDFNGDGFTDLTFRTLFSGSMMVFEECSRAKRGLVL
jgi:hypothetical protein